MKHLFFIALIFSAFGARLEAQVDSEQREERVKAYRVAMFTETLRLTADEAQGFWPVYNDYLDKREQVQQQLKPAKQLDAMSDNEVEDQIRRHFDLKQRELELEKELYQNLRKVLPLRKIAKLPAAEREFRESLVKKLQELRQQRQQDRPRRLPANGRGRR
jgi:hypothetical protein